MVQVRLLSGTGSSSGLAERLPATDAGSASSTWPLTCRVFVIVAIIQSVPREPFCLWGRFGDGRDPHRISACARRPDKPVAWGSGTCLACRWRSQAAVTAGPAPRHARRTRLPEVMLLSNSFSPGQGALEHAMDALAAFFGGVRQVLFIPYAASDPDQYTEATREILGRLGVRV